jgi:hypothetical protein
MAPMDRQQIPRRTNQKPGMAHTGCAALNPPFF